MQNSVLFQQGQAEKNGVSPSVCGCDTLVKITESQV